MDDDNLLQTACKVDIALSACIIVAQLSNIATAYTFYSKRSLAEWMGSAHVASFAFGAIGGVFCVILALARMGILDMYTAQDTFSRINNGFIVCQTYLQAIVIVQKVHLVNAHALGSDAITMHELLAKRYPELAWTVWFLFTFSMVTAGTVDTVMYLTVTVWMATIIVMDVVLSMVSLSKVHRMLNTGEQVMTWMLRVLFTGRSARASAPPAIIIHRPSTQTTSSSTFALAGAKIPRIVREWTAVMLAICGAVGLHAVAFNVLYYSPLYYPTFRLAWLFGAFWQRGSLMYIELVRQVAYSNRSKKQYMGSVTNTGIVFSLSNNQKIP